MLADRLALFTARLLLALSEGERRVVIARLQSLSGSTPEGNLAYRFALSALSYVLVRR
jgi:hypothetical protein